MSWFYFSKLQAFNQRQHFPFFLLKNETFNEIDQLLTLSNENVLF